jgi:SAM-dependent methyltransferase
MASAGGSRESCSGSFESMAIEPCTVHCGTAPALRAVRSANVSTPFAGTASYYARYRPPYPDALLADLRLRAATTGHGTLLDLACGPGRVAIPMAAHFGRVLAVDAEAEMVAVGTAAAQRRGAANVSWLIARAEDLRIARGSIELITIGEAFHRLDQPQCPPTGAGVAGTGWLAGDPRR